jgi:hypothetical protein
MHVLGRGRSVEDGVFSSAYGRAVLQYVCMYSSYAAANRTSRSFPVVHSAVGGREREIMH